MGFNARSILLGLLFLTSSTWLVAHAQDFSSTNFTVSNPVIFPGGYSTSTNFGLSGVISQMAIGTSTATTFNLFGGFLYFPFVSSPVLGATAGNASVSLSWTTADSVLGWVIGGYSVGQSGASGGPYTYTNVGNVLSSNRTGLTNGVQYFFIIKVSDALSNFIATSTEVTSTPVASSGGGGGGGGGGGSGGGSPPSSGGGSVNLSGRAYPRSQVTLMKDAQIITTITAGADGTFQTVVNNLSSGNYIFSLYAEDKDGVRSSLLTFPSSITYGATTNISGIFVAPTIGVDKSQVKRGDNIGIFGQSAPQADVIISVHSDQEYFARIISDKNGIYLYSFDTVVLGYGDHATKSKATIANELVSPYSALANFIVGTQNVTQGPVKKCSKTGDVNADCRVNLVDYSIIAYWYKRSNPPKIADLNGDGKVTLVDFSILAYYWTG